MAQNMDLSAGRITIGGHILSQGVFDKNGNFRLDAEMAPEIGVFVMDGLETFVRLRLSGPLVVNAPSTYEAKPLRFGGDLGVRFYWDTGTCFYPYAGFALGVDALGTLNTRYWSLEIPAGVMLSVNDSIGITLSAAFRAEATFYDHAAPSLFYFPFGIFGVKVFI